MNIVPSERILALFPNSTLLPDRPYWFNRLRVTEKLKRGGEQTFNLARFRPSGEWMCNCRAATSRGSCRHLDRIRELT